MKYQHIEKVTVTTKVERKNVAHIEFDAMRVSNSRMIDLLLRAIELNVTVEELTKCSVSSRSYIADDKVVLLKNGKVVAVVEA